MSDSIRHEDSLSSELSALRSALGEVEAPDDEAALRRAANLRAAQHEVRRETREPIAGRPAVPAAEVFLAARARAGRARRRLVLAAAAAAAGLVAVGVLVAERAERAVSSSSLAQTEQAGRHAAPRVTDATTATTTAPLPSARAAFRPISFTRGLSPAESYSVVRVRLELASTTLRAGAPNAAIEADLLVGEDGLARAIRFDSADTLPVYTAFGPPNGERR